MSHEQSDVNIHIMVVVETFLYFSNFNIIITPKETGTLCGDENIVKERNMGINLYYIGR